MHTQEILQYLSDGLSLITITLCVVLKVPQIMKLLDNKSARGISLTGLLLELTSYSIMTSYNFVNGYSMMLYMEYLFLLAQEYFLIYLVLKYQNLISTRTLMAVILYQSIWTGFLTQVIPKTILTILVPLCQPLSASNKVVQLFTILRAKNADSVAPLTWFLAAFTHFIRAVTVWMDSADMLIMFNLLISCTQSSLIMTAALYYNMDRHKKKSE